jgi:hypothetical protein
LSLLGYSQRPRRRFEVLLEQADCGDSSGSGVDTLPRVFERNSAQREHRHLPRLAATDAAQRFQTSAWQLAFAKHRAENGEVGAFGFGQQEFALGVAGDRNHGMRNACAIENGSRIGG